jgi:PAS domain S-box-containing protein
LFRPDITIKDSHFRQLVDGITDYAIYMLDPGGRVLSWNKGAQRLKQYAADEVIGAHYRKFYTEDDQQRRDPEHALDVAKLKGRCQKTSWHMRKDGTRFQADVVITAILDDRGRLIGFANVTRDAGQRLQTEQKIREASMLKALINTAMDGVMMMDSRGIIQVVNPACEKLFGYGRQEMIGHNVKMLLPPPFPDGYDSGFENERRSGIRKIIGIGREVVGRRKDGGVFPMCISLGEAQQGREPTFVAIMHDLTERKRTEEQLVQAQKMDTIGQLSGGIAHDFNNLLTVIIGNADLMLENVQDQPEMKQLCDTILAAGERGAELTRRLLAFSRRQTLQPVATDCGKLIESMQMMLRRTLSEDIEIRISADPKLLKAYADPAQLESAILNLALNARDAMPRGGHLTITAGNASLDEHYQAEHVEVMPGDYVMIAVTDDGEGMPQEIRARVFEPFFSTKGVGKGSGLGLSMVYGFVRQSNGHVSIYSEPGLGTTVRMYLPAAAEAPGAAALPRTAVDLAALRGKETVLVTEDDPFVRNHAVTSLRKFGYNVLTATDGREALAILAQGTPVDILFSDVVMPGGINGCDLAGQAKKHRPALKVLLTSGYPMETLAARQGGNLPAAILNKPYRKIELAQRLRDVLDNAQDSKKTSST